MGARITKAKPSARGCLRRTALGAAIVTGGTALLTLALIVGVIAALWIFSWVSI